MTGRLEQIMAQFGGLAASRLAPELQRDLRAAVDVGLMTRAEAKRAAWDHLAEADRVALVKAAGAVPDVCGDAIPVAPARGAVRVFDILASYPKGAEGSELKPAGHLGRKTMERLDVFGRMAAQSRRRGGDGVLTASQVATGRLYRTLVEDREAGAVRCISAEAMAMGGAGGGTREGFTDHRLALSVRIDRMQAAIGAGFALRSRRDAARVLPVRVLVDMVCLMDADVSDVVARHGFPPRNGRALERASAALAAALDRMAAPRGRVAGQNFTVI